MCFFNTFFAVTKINVQQSHMLSEHEDESKKRMERIFVKSSFKKIWTKSYASISYGTNFVIFFSKKNIHKSSLVLLLAWPQLWSWMEPYWYDIKRHRNWVPQLLQTSQLRAYYFLSCCTNYLKVCEPYPSV